MEDPPGNPECTRLPWARTCRRGGRSNTGPCRRYFCRTRCRPSRPRFHRSRRPALRRRLGFQLVHRSPLRCRPCRRHFRPSRSSGRSCRHRRLCCRNRRAQWEHRCSASEQQACTSLEGSWSLADVTRQTGVTSACPLLTGVLLRIARGRRGRAIRGRKTLHALARRGEAQLPRRPRGAVSGARALNAEALRGVAHACPARAGSSAPSAAGCRAGVAGDVARFTRRAVGPGKALDTLTRRDVANRIPALARAVGGRKTCR